MGISLFFGGMVMIFLWCSLCFFFLLLRGLSHVISNPPIFWGVPCFRFDELGGVVLSKVKFHLYSYLSYELYLCGVSTPMIDTGAIPLITTE